MSDERRIMLNHVKVGERARKDLGDLGDLMESIREVGLLQPIVLDDKDRLIAGQRRLEAVRALGWPSIPFVTAKRVKDATQHIVAERDENTCRKPMTPTEEKFLADAIRALHAPENEARMKAGKTLSSNELRVTNPTDKAAAEALGTNRSRLQRIDTVVNAALDDSNPEVQVVAMKAQEEMDAGSLSVSAAARKVVAAKRDAPLTKLAKLNAGTRAEQIRKRTEQGMRASQIADDIGVVEEHVRKIANDHNITLVDQALGRPRRIDSNRVVRETVDALAGLAYGIDLIEWDAIDQSELPGWVASLDDSLRRINRFHKQTKEATHG